MSNSLSLLLDFTEIRPVLAPLMSLTMKLLKIYIYLINHAQTSLFDDYAGGTQEVQLLNDQIWAKYQLLDSEECGAVGAPAFNAEYSKLCDLMARMSKLGI